MALASVGFFNNVVLVDSGGNKATLRYQLTSADMATAQADAAADVALLDAVTQALVKSYNVGESFEDGAADFAVQGVHIENLASIVARIDSVEKKFAQIKIPAPRDEIFQALTGEDSNDIDPANADLVAYLNIWETAGGNAELSDGETLLSPGTAGNVSGKRIHRKSRKG